MNIMMIINPNKGKWVCKKKKKWHNSYNLWRKYSSGAKFSMPNLKMLLYFELAFVWCEKSNFNSIDVYFYENKKR